ncbi:hypothetical protein NUKP71_27090 [Klebsiella quasipneumoniae]|nr:hypothetical protein NUKP71_27090 [Klebsiella quasipneumoniae]
MRRFYCRVAAAPYPAYLSGSDCQYARASAAPPGKDRGHGADFVPGGGCALPGLEGSCDLSLIYPLARLKLPGLAGARGNRGRRRRAAACALPAP